MLVRDGVPVVVRVSKVNVVMYNLKGWWFVAIAKWHPCAPRCLNSKSAITGRLPDWKKCLTCANNVHCGPSTQINYVYNLTGCNTQREKNTTTLSYQCTVAPHVNQLYLTGIFPAWNTTGALNAVMCSKPQLLRLIITSRCFEITCGWERPIMKSANEEKEIIKSTNRKAIHEVSQWVHCCPHS